MFRMIEDSLSIVGRVVFWMLGELFMFSIVGSIELPQTTPTTPNTKTTPPLG